MALFDEAYPVGMCLGRYGSCTLTGPGHFGGMSRARREAQSVNTRQQA